MTDFLKDVPASSPEPEDLNEDLTNDPIEDDPSSEPTSQETGHGEGKDDDNEGRTIENVHREFSRKMERLEGRLFEALEENQRLIRESITGIARPEKQTGNTLDDMSLSELESLRAQVAEQNPDKLLEYDSYLNKRRVDEQVNQRMAQFETRSQTENRRREANRVAVDRYPELGKRGSDFYRAVNSRLAELGNDYVQANPRAVLDAANDVAAERGISPSRRQVVRGAVGTRRDGGGAPVNKPDEGSADRLPKSARTAEDRAAIAKRLGAALPGGKQFDDAAIQKRMAEYGDNLHYYLRG